MNFRSALNLLKKILLLGIPLIFLISCVGGSGGGRKPKKLSLTTDDELPTPTPTPFATNLNFLELGNVAYNSLLNISSTYNDSIFLKGNQINDYLLSKSNSESQLCMVVHFPSSSGNNHLILAAIGRKVPASFSTGLKDYYFEMRSIDADINKAYCQKADLLNTLTTDNPGASFSYLFSTVCPNCQNILSSSWIKLYAQNGQEISGSSLGKIQLSHLSFQLQKTTSNNQNGFCTNNAQCSAYNFDCCLNSQCVNDKTTKSNIDQSSTSYQLAVNEINTNPNKIYNYPQFFNLCGINPGQTPTPTPTPDAALVQALYLEKMRHLYECTTLLDEYNEQSICTKIYTDAPATISGGGVFTNDVDDRDFTSTYSGTPGNLLDRTIYEIFYGGGQLYKESVVQDPSITFAASNDDVSNGQTVTITATLTSDAPHDLLKIRYKIDGSCERVNVATAKCFKYYIQNQDLGKPNDHLTGNQNFMLPSYADSTKSIKVTTDGSSRSLGSDYTVGGTPLTVSFLAANPVFDNQAVKIEYYVNLSSNPSLLVAKESALSEINTQCNCGTQNCSLTPETQLINGVSTVTGYKCVYPNNNGSNQPLDEEIFVNAKTAPVRFYDTNGVNYDTKSINEITQEGTAFSYDNSNYLTPNNISADVGFNEIYGSISDVSISPRKPEVVNVVKGKLYDIYVQNGSFNTCSNCGSDYYTFVNLLFPSTFITKGGGWFPDPSRTSRVKNSTIISTQYRADDILFGRACFIPATMIPWTHRGTTTTLVDQRQARLAAQHFLFANGYYRDWYGFDYGSIIGSFDGIKWFSIGSNRRISAESGKLFIAVNAYFADLTESTAFTVRVMDATFVSGSGPNVTKNADSDGAFCRRYHLCSKDSDCVANLGWEYACETVSSIRSTWPRTDDNATERPDVVGSETASLLSSIAGGLDSNVKRCVYRGRGAPCHQLYTTTTSASAYHQSTVTGLNTCSMGTYCANLTQSLFNKKISRFARPPNVQNTSSDVPVALREDEFGLSAHLIGRPFNYNGSDSVSASIQTQLAANQVSSICINGRDPLLPSTGSNTFLTQHSRAPGTEHQGDRVLNMGMTYTSLTLANNQYFNSCSIFDSDGGFLRKSLSTTDLQDTSIKQLAATQTTSTNILKALEVSGISLVKDFDNEQVDTVFYQENRCLRNANSTCFTDFDCAPNEIIANQVSGLDPSTTGLSQAELDYWKEELICGQKSSKSASTYIHTTNRCCRDLGKTLTIYSDDNDAATIATTASTGPGVDVAISSGTRYSRMNTVYDLINKVTTPLPGLKVVPEDSARDISGANKATNHPLKQHDTFYQVAARTCCSGNWVREFSTANGGGHHWLPSKMQTIGKENFQCVNWDGCIDAVHGTANCALTFSCADSNCPIRNISIAEGDRYLNWISQFELTGIPQILIQSDTTDFTGADNIYCAVDPVTATTTTANTHIPNTLKSVRLGNATADAISSVATSSYVRADQSADMESTIKQVFDSKTVSCCLPAGETVPTNTTDAQCCTGKVFQNRCCLEDFTNLSVYLNRYVSSEASSLADSAFDPDTGYISDPSIVEQLAFDKNLCCSGQTSTFRGTAISELKLPGLSSTDVARARRFVEGNGDSEDFNGAASGYDAGLRWNTHVYCVPANFSSTN